MAHLPKHTVQRRDLLNYNGTVENYGIFVRSGSIADVSGSTTGSIILNFDALALRLRRAEVFHSGTAASNFNFSIESSSPNTGSFYDPRNLTVCYNDVPGARDYNGGLDQIEDLYVVTDNSSESRGNLYLKFMPYGGDVHEFKYLLFFEAVFVYQNKDGGING